MGYNGGTNKRGYYRHVNGMYSKSSYKSGSRIFTNTILGGLGLLASAGSALSTSSEDLSLDNCRTPKHFNPKKQRIKFILWGIIAILCPIGSFVTFELTDMWLSICVLIFGFIETMIAVGITTPTGNIDYIYDNEVERVNRECKTNRIILIALHSILFILNLYPIVLFAIYYMGFSYGSPAPIKSWDGGTTSIAFFIVLIKLVINGSLIVETLRDKRSVEYFQIVSKKEDNHSEMSKSTILEKSTTSSILDSSKVKGAIEDPNSDFVPECDTVLPIQDIKLSPINGTYMESFYGASGTLHIGTTSASISFCFPGIDGRYKSTYFSIPEEKIDNYIQAYEKNWQIAEKLLEQAINFPNVELKQTGDMGMYIVVKNDFASIYLYCYELPIHSKKACFEMIEALRKAKLRITQVREKLFG